MLLVVIFGYPKKNGSAILLMFDCLNRNRSFSNHGQVRLLPTCSFILSLHCLFYLQTCVEQISYKEASSRFQKYGQQAVETWKILRVYTFTTGYCEARFRIETELNTTVAEQNRRGTNRTSLVQKPSIVLLLSILHVFTL